MPRARKPVPTYRLHKPTGQAVVTVRTPDGGRQDVYLGAYGSEASRAEYARLVKDLERPTATPKLPGPGVTVAEVLLAFLRHADGYYRRADGTRTNEVNQFKLAARAVRALFAGLPAAEFGPRCLKSVRDAMVAAGISRTQVNARVNRVRAMFRWAASEELVPASVVEGLRTVAGLLAGRTHAREQFQPGADTAAAPVTQHLARSEFQLFLFDPTMDPRFRRLYDPAAADRGRNERQEMILLEAVSRVRKLTGLPTSAKTDRPLIVVLTKSDVWGRLAGDAAAGEPWAARTQMAGLDLDLIRGRSDRLRGLLASSCPELVHAAEGFSTAVTYVAVSVLGTPPDKLDVGGAVQPAIRPRDIHPSGVLVPFVYGLHRTIPRLFLVRRKKRTEDSAGVQRATRTDGVADAAADEKRRTGA